MDMALAIATIPIAMHWCLNTETYKYICVWFMEKGAHS